MKTYPQPLHSCYWSWSPTAGSLQLAETPGVIGRVNEPTTEKLDESLSGLPALFGITLYGNDLKQLYDAAASVEEVAGKVKGLSNIVNNTRIPVDQIRLAIDRAALARFDVSAQTVAQAVRTAMQGDSISQVIIKQQPIDIFLGYSNARRNDLEALKQVQVPGPKGRLIPLSQLVHV